METLFSVRAHALQKRTTTAALAIALTVSLASPATAGGFAVREQSSSFLGMAFAGAAAGGDLSSSYWNPAAFGTAKPGITTESHYAIITANTRISGEVDAVPSNAESHANIPAGAPPFLTPAFIDGAIDQAFAGAAAGINQGANSTTIDRPAVVPASYGAYRITDKLVLGISINSPFGLSSEPDDVHYSGSTHGLSSSLLTFNAAPTLTYEVARGMHLAAGVQLQHASLNFKFLDPQNGPVEVDVADEIGVGYTLGFLWRPSAGTSFGVGLRSKIEHDFDGVTTRRDLAESDTSAKLELPEIVTVSLSQAISPALRGHLTYEWTNWSRFDSTPVNGTSGLDAVAAAINANLSTFGVTATPQDRALDGPWEDGHFVSGGLEYDYNPQLTLRTGLAWEKSPIQSPEARLLQVPDSDRIWLGFGATYHWSEMTSIDFGYTHIFFEDADISRASLAAPNLVFNGQVQNSADIFAISLKTKWGKNGLQDTIAGLFGAN